MGSETRRPEEARTNQCRLRHRGTKRRKPQAKREAAPVCLLESRPESPLVRVFYNHLKRQRSLSCLGSDTSVGISCVDQVCVSKSVRYGRDSVREITFLLILSLLCVAPAMAQSPTATINGIVLDPSGAPIAGAEVLIVNDGTGAQFVTKTNGDGIYLIPNLPPGTYRLQ